jgi:hypothetical protein
MIKHDYISVLNSFKHDYIDAVSLVLFIAKNTNEDELYQVYKGSSRDIL